MYLGVDIHGAFCQTTVMDGDGAIVDRAKVPTDPEHLEAFFQRFAGSEAVIESNAVWEFVYEKRRSLGIVDGHSILGQSRSPNLRPPSAEFLPLPPPANPHSVRLPPGIR